MMEERLFYKFSESNDNEGETWHFFVQLTPEQVGLLEDFIETEGSGDYWLSDEQYPESEVDILVKHSDLGYMPTYNKVGSLKFDISEYTFEDFEDVLYKGGLWTR